MIAVCGRSQGLLTASSYFVLLFNHHGARSFLRLEFSSADSAISVPFPLYFGFTHSRFTAPLLLSMFQDPVPQMDSPLLVSPRSHPLPMPYAKHANTKHETSMSMAAGAMTFRCNGFFLWVLFRLLVNISIPFCTVVFHTSHQFPPSTT